MKEFWIIKNGVGYIEYGNSIDEICCTSCDSIEEHDLGENYDKKTLTKEENDYYEKLFEENNKTFFDYQVDKLLSIITYCNPYESKIIMGIRHNIKKGCKISEKQKNTINNIYKKYIS